MPKTRAQPKRRECLDWIQLHPALDLAAPSVGRSTLPLWQRPEVQKVLRKVIRPLPSRNSHLGSLYPAARSRLSPCHDAGRLSTVTDGTDTFTYGYRYTSANGLHTGSASGTEATMPFTLAGPQVTTTLAYDATRNTLVSRQNNITSGTLSKFTYGVNNLGQRETVITTGNAFGTNPANWTWRYDALGQVISADSPADSNDRAYQYDSIGNRKFSETAKTSISSPALDGTTAYTANGANQYSDLRTGTGQVPFTPVSAYDLDGNMTAGPITGSAGVTPGAHAPEAATSLKWDAENRLIAATVGLVTVNYAYDHLSRLIRRDDGTTVTHYLYDGWNRIAEFTGQSLDKVYLWGMDLSGTMQGAGGVGGLLSVSEVQNGQVINWHYPTYDGNGNVSEYIGWLDDTDPNISGNQPGYVSVAHFEYDPFGNLTVDSENNAASFPYRFSTKPQDPVTGLLYYGYRFYDPLTGRWPSRDPIAERGGVNLYGFVRNDGVNLWDLWGMLPPDLIGDYILSKFTNHKKPVTCNCSEDLGRFKDLEFTLETTFYGVAGGYTFSDPSINVIGPLGEAIAEDWGTGKLEDGSAFVQWQELNKKLIKLFENTKRLLDAFKLVENIKAATGNLTVHSIRMDATIQVCEKTKSGKFEWIERAGLGEDPDVGMSMIQFPTDVAERYIIVMKETAKQLAQTISDAKKN